MLVLESECLLRKQLCASACSLRKFGEAVDSSLLLTKIVRIRCKTLIVFNGRDLLLSKTCFFFSKVNKKPRTFFVVRLVSEKISHPHLATHLIKNENNSNTCSLHAAHPAHDFLSRSFLLMRY